MTAPQPAWPVRRSPIVETMISAVIGFVLIVAVDAIGYVATEQVTELASSQAWWFYAVGEVLAVVVLAAWSRSAARAIAVVGVMAALFGYERLFASDIDVEFLHAWGDLAHYLTYVAWPLGWIVGWGIARRRSALAWVGFAPAAVLVGLWGWVVLADFSLAGWIYIVTPDVIIVVGILLMWGCDALGQASGSSGSTPNNPHGSNPHWAPAPHPMPTHPPQSYHQQPYPPQVSPAPQQPTPMYPPTRDLPTRPDQR